MSAQANQQFQPADLELCDYLCTGITDPADRLFTPLFVVRAAIAKVDHLCSQDPTVSEFAAVLACIAPARTALDDLPRYIGPNRERLVFADCEHSLIALTDDDALAMMRAALSFLRLALDLVTMVAAQGIPLDYAPAFETLHDLSRAIAKCPAMSGPMAGLMVETYTDGHQEGGAA